MRTLIFSTILLLSGCSGLNAAPPARHAHANKAPETAAIGVEVVFSASEIKTIRAYYEGHGSGHAAGKGKGKHKHKSLPPGIAKNLARGKPLPPGIAKRSLPYDLTRQLPRPRSGYEIIVVAGKVLLIEVATQIVRDVLTDAVFS
jgi:Ni/Co efflux regulator RcnB